MTLRTWHKSIGSRTRPVTRLLKTGLYTPTVGVDWQSPPYRCPCNEPLFGGNTARQLHE